MLSYGASNHVENLMFRKPLQTEEQWSKISTLENGEELNAEELNAEGFCDSLYEKSE